LIKLIIKHFQNNLTINIKFKLSDESSSQAIGFPKQ